MKLYVAGPLFSEAERAWLDALAARLRAEGFDCFVPHENFTELADVTLEQVYRIDTEGIRGANALVAWLDGPMVDDGTACEIGIFWGLAQSDPSKKGVIGLNTDFRGARNRFVLGCLGRMGGVVETIDDAVEVLRAWESERG